MEGAGEQGPSRYTMSGVTLANSDSRMLSCLVVPVVLAQILRRSVLSRAGLPGLNGLLARLQPISLAALLTTVVLLFGFQGDQIIEQPLIIALLAVPILIQVYLNSCLAYLLNPASGDAPLVAGPFPMV